MKRYNFLNLEPSQRKHKKFEIKFFDSFTGKIISVHFGDKRYEDYTIHKDKGRREAYIKRHIGNVKKSDNVISPAYLSMFLLWGDSTNINDNLTRYLDRFDLF